jgi:hypothetical protein
MRRFGNYNTHQRRFIGLATVIFALVAILHAGRVLLGGNLIIGGVALPQSLSVLAAFVTAMMAIMGGYYYLANNN